MKTQKFLFPAALALCVSTPAPAQTPAYNSSVQPYPQTMQQAAPAAPLPQGSLTANIEVRLSDLESQIRDLTGRIEQQGFELRQTKENLEKLSADTDIRFRQLETAGAQQTGTGEMQTPPPPTAATSQPTAQLPSAPFPEKVLGNIQETPSGKIAPPVEGAPEDAYNNAFTLLKKGAYEEAEKAFLAFLAKYPQHPLAGNAQYWLGETYYVRGDILKAAAVFAESVQKYPNSPKGPDTLLKLALSLGNLGRTQDACLTLAELTKRFPTASPIILQRAGEEKTKLQCP